MAATDVKRSAEAPPGRAAGTTARPTRTRFSRELALYVVRGVAVYSIVAFIILETVLGVTGTVRATEEFNVDFLIILPVLLRAMAQAINYTLPVALLFGCGLLIGRMRADRELLSVASFGISPFQIVLPVALAGSVLAGVMYPYVDHVVPGFRYQNRNVATLIMDQLPYLGEGFNLEFSQPPHHIWIRHYIGAELYGVLITLGGETDRNRDDKGPLSSDALEDVDSATYPLYLFAASARLIEDTGDSGEYSIELRDVSIFMDSDFFGGDTESDFVQRGYMSSWTFRIPARRKRPGIKDRTGPVLRELARSQLELHDELMARLEKRDSGKNGDPKPDEPPPDPKELAQKRADTIKKAEHALEQHRSAVREQHRRVAFSLTCLTFPLAAFAIGLFITSLNRLLPFFAASTIVPGTYFGLELFGGNLAERGILAGVTEQLGNIALVVMSVILLALVRRGPTR